MRVFSSICLIALCAAVGATTSPDQGAYMRIKGSRTKTFSPFTRSGMIQVRLSPETAKLATRSPKQQALATRPSSLSGTPAPQPTEFRIYKLVDKSTPLLKEAFRTKEPLPEIVFQLYRPSLSGKVELFAQVKLERCFIKSWSTSGDADDRPTEEVAFYYNKMTWTPAKKIQAADAWKAGG